ncbi:CoA transferase [Mycolicibacterium sp. 018/SC-01/001]|uniref:CaiB/BaiF CoA transferase family protein n=1 Tax=Mycolicibacterium sp. 018/SC-01/001 TaxID=2592069 RepID=UPI001180C2A1|nr:CoA transferase [Mycolicibacterium sp. 018/SC-01/001]TRW79617.1 CoA transferase [Mycolicibacterium sp. 018/SC-01/001]
MAGDAAGDTAGDTAGTTAPLTGVRVLEVAAWTFVPSAGAVLSEWGAEVIKVEPRVGGDPQRGLMSMGLLPEAGGGVDYMIEVPNRGKKSIGVDLGTPGGRDVLHRLVRSSDVFLTSYLPSVRAKLGVDVDDIRRFNPDIVYVRGSGYGPSGPDADRPGYDGVSFWSRGGVCAALSRGGEPVVQTPAFGDLLGGMALAGGVAAALLRRATTGETAVVDVSLLSLAAWTMSPRITAEKLYDPDPLPYPSHADMPNPLAGTYRTADGRYVTLMMLQRDRFYDEFMHAAGRPDLITDPRFAGPEGRYANRRALVAELDAEFGSRPLSHWRSALASLSGAWSVQQTCAELPDDPDVAGNGYIATVQANSGADYVVPTNPVQFDTTPVHPRCAPEHGQHTEEVLLAAGLTWAEIDRLKTEGAIL